MDLRPSRRPFAGWRLYYRSREVSVSMSRMTSIRLKGLSGTSYLFQLYPWGTTFKSVGAVYIVARRAAKPGGGFHHKRIYLGETADMSQNLGHGSRRDEFQRRAANCICVHPEKDQGRRQEIQNDLRRQSRPRIP